MSFRKTSLFVKGNLQGYLDGRQAEAGSLVMEMKESDFQKLGEQAILENVSSMFRFEKTLLNIDQHWLEATEVEVDTADYPSDFAPTRGKTIMAPGMQFTLRIPFEGKENLFHLRPSRFISNPPFAHIQTQGNSKGEVWIRLQGPAHKDAAYFENFLLAEENKIITCLQNQEAQIEKFVSQDLPLAIQNAINARNARINQKEKLISGFKIPLRKKTGAPSLPIRPNRIIPKRPLSQPTMPPPQKGTEQEIKKPQPFLDDREYHDILSLIRHQCRTFEGAPASFGRLSEESLRDVMLSALNAIYEGEATGETFRKSGKSDIRIEAGDRSAFIAECKIWTGKKNLLEAIGQLAGYLTWRDSKTALVVLNKRNRKFTDILREVPLGCESHSQFERISETDFKGEWDVVFRHKDDPGGTFNCRVMAFNIYQAKKKTKEG